MVPVVVVKGGVVGREEETQRKGRRGRGEEEVWVRFSGCTVWREMVKAKAEHHEERKLKGWLVAENRLD